MRTAILRLIKDVNNQIANVQRLNSGGCGVYAALMTTQFKKYGIDAAGRVLTPSHRRYLKEPNIIDTTRDLTKTCSTRVTRSRVWASNVGLYHVIGAIKIDNSSNEILFDSTLISSRRKVNFPFWGDELPIFNGHLSTEELAELAAVREIWNPVFNRRQIPKIRKIIDSCFVKHLGECE